MTAEEFIFKIQKLSPSLDDLKKLGWPEELFDRTMKSYLAKPKTNPARHSYEDEVLKLVHNYDLSTLSILDLTFFDKITEEDNFFSFGYDDTFYLILNKITGEIEWYDLAYDRLIMQCARNGALFLDALFAVKEIHTKWILEGVDVMADDFNADKEAYMCSLMAGGEKYEDFYRGILGAQ